jgi:phosphohistidine phosphatase SixA
VGRRHLTPESSPIDLSRIVMSRIVMSRIAIRTLLCLFALVAVRDPARAEESAAWAALRQGGHVALMRHAEAPGGTGDPPGFRLDDCATQRNLSAEGRADAKAVGEKLKAEGVIIGQLLSSPWCRCVDTARLMDVGAVEIAPTFGNVVVLSDQRAALTEGARAVIGSWKGPKTLLVVTHGANIQALTGGYNPASGEIVVVAAESEGTIREVGRIPVPAR